jgi:DHA1 family tetracycline resistance protein-like MFS transporter
VPASEQGLLQGALASVNTATAVVGPPLANGLFAYFVSPAAPVVLPGAPFFLGSALFLVSLLLAVRNLTAPGAPVRLPAPSPLTP